MRNIIKYGIFLVVTLSLLTLNALALSNSSNDIIQLPNDSNEPITFSVSGSPLVLNHEELISNSDTIVIGTVKEILPSKYGDRFSKDTDFGPDHVIYTDIIISVDEYLKNPLSSNEVRVRVAGGTIGNDTLIMEEEASFKTGEKVLLYLTKDTSHATQNIGPEHFVVTGCLQGKYTLTDDGKAIRPDENTTLDELLSTINQTENKTKDTKMSENTETARKQEENSTSTPESKNAPFISSFWTFTALFGVVMILRGHRWQ
jgi:hypothetical protein